MQQSYLKMKTVYTVIADNKLEGKWSVFRYAMYQYHHYERTGRSVSLYADDKLIKSTEN